MWYESPNGPGWAKRLSMPKKRHKAEQIISKLRDADAMLAAGKTIGKA